MGQWKPFNIGQLNHNGSEVDMSGSVTTAEPLYSAYNDIPGHCMAPPDMFSFTSPYYDGATCPLDSPRVSNYADVGHSLASSTAITPAIQFYHQTSQQWPSDAATSDFDSCMVHPFEYNDISGNTVKSVNRFEHGRASRNGTWQANSFLLSNAPPEAVLPQGCHTGRTGSESINFGGIDGTVQEEIKGNEVVTRDRTGLRHNPPKVFNCQTCGRQYCRKSTLKAHMKQHMGDKPFICQVCGKTFSQAANLTAHRRVHTGEKPFACSICLRPFSQSSSLVTHRRTHTGERPYPCMHCTKSFTDSSTLTKHMRTHTGQKPYSCHLCMMRFSQSGNLHRHMKTHRADGVAL